MAVAMRTFGNTLSELQAGTNADKGLDYQRANAQDAINAQRLESFLRLRGQALQAKAQQNEKAADRAQRMAEMLQQNQQFGTSQGNTLKLGEMDAKSRLDVAKEMAAGRGMDPRAFQTIVEADQYNKEGQARVVEANRLSQAMKDATDEIKAAEGWHWYRGNSDEYSTFKKLYNREPDAKAATEALARIRARAAELKLSPMADGSFYAPPFVPVQIPNTGRMPITVEPAPVGQSRVPAMLQGDVTIGGQPFFQQPGFGGEIAPPVDVLAPSTIQPTRTVRIGADGRAYYVQ